MSDPSQEDLRLAVEAQHGGYARLHSVVPIDERHAGKPVWQGNVHVFDLSGHPKANRAYAWSSAVEGSTKRRFYAVLGVSPIFTAVDAVRAAIVADAKVGRSRQNCRAAVAMVASIAPCFVAAEPASLNNIQDLYQRCISTDTAVREGCIGLLTGSAEVLIMLGRASADKDYGPEVMIAFSAIGICNVRASPAAIRQAFVNWAEKNPTKWSEPRVHGVMEALSELYPCGPPRAN